MSDLTNKRSERISAFLDNEMHSDELMSFSLSAEAEDSTTAQRYQMVGDALRGEISDASFVDVSHAVRDALAGENIAEQVSAAQVNTTQVNTTRANAADETPHFLAGLFDANWFKPAAGVAVAALVAVVMVTVVSEQNPQGNTVAGNDTAAPAVANPVLGEELNVAIENNTTTTDPRANQHLVNQHLESATQNTMQGRLPYVRAVSYESDK